MAINFPNSPTNGQQISTSDRIYTYDASSGRWDGKTTSIGADGLDSSSIIGLVDSAYVASRTTSVDFLAVSSNILPDADSSRDLGSPTKKWKDLHLSGNTLTLGGIKLKDAGGSLKVETDAGADVSPGGGATSYANFAAFPSSGNTAGDIGFATDTKAVYMWDNSSWQRMSIGNQLGPRYTTTPSADITLPQDGSTTTITGVAVDDGGFPVTYDWDAFRDSSGTAILYDSSNLPPQITASSRDSGVITLTPSTNLAHEGNFSFRLKASDGVLSTPAITTVGLSFITYVTVDTEQNQSGNKVQPTTNGTLEWYNNTSGGSTSTLYLPYGGTNVAPLGKRYIEFKYFSTTNTSYGRRAMIGVATRYYAEQYSSVVGYSGNRQYVDYYYGYNGTKYPGATAQDLSAVLVGDIVQLAYDTDAEKVWLGKNNTWSTLSGDPGAGGAGISVQATKDGVTGYSLILATGTASSYTSVWEAGKQSSSDTYAYAIPSGFLQF